MLCKARGASIRVSQEADEARGKHGQKSLLWFSMEYMAEAG